MHHQPTSKIETSQLTEPPIAQDPVTYRSINQRYPQYHEDDEGTEFHPLRECSGNQRGGDDHEHPLKRKKDVVRDRQSFLDRGPNATAHEVVQTAYKAANIRSKGEAVPVHKPD